MTKYKHGIAGAQKFMEPVRRAAPRPRARRPGGGFGLLRVFAQWGTWRSQALGLNVRPQCGHCRKSLVSKS